MADRWCAWLRLVVDPEMAAWCEAFAAESPEPWCDDYRLREMVGGRAYEWLEAAGQTT